MAITSDNYNIRVRLEPEQLELLQALAVRNERKLTQEIRLAVRRHLEREIAKEAK